jgi:hypothetical protein
MAVLGKRGRQPEHRYFGRGVEAQVEQKTQRQHLPARTDAGINRVKQAAHPAATRGQQ